MNSSFLRNVLFSLFAVVGTASLPAAAADSPPDLEQQLLGTWVLIKADVPGKPSGIGTRRKTFTPGHWQMIQDDPKTGKMVFHHGGTYRLNGHELEQTVEYAGKSTSTFVHQTRKFRITIDGDIYTQTGIGNPFNEVWKRVTSPAG